MHYLKPRPTEVKAGEIIHKAFVCDTVKAVDESKRQIDFVISTERVDRMGDVITVAGWQLKEFKNNPVVLFGHASRVPPVGRAVKVWKEQTDVSRALRSTAEFMTADISPFADSIYKMYLGGFLRAVSVGFTPVEWDVIKDEKGNFTGYRFTKQELLEFSCVPIPANPDALLEARSKGIDTMPIKDWAEELLDNWAEEKDPVRLMYDLDRKGLELLRRRATGFGKALIVPGHVQDNLLAKNLEAIKKAKELAATPGVEVSLDALPEVEAKDCESIVMTRELTGDGEFVFIETAPKKVLVPREFVDEQGVVDGVGVTFAAKNQTATYLATGRVQDSLVLELASLEDTPLTQAEIDKAAEVAAAEAEAQETAASEAATKEAAEKAAAESGEERSGEASKAEEATEKAPTETVVLAIATMGQTMEESCDILEEVLAEFEDVLKDTANQGTRSTRTNRKIQFLAGYMRELAQLMHPAKVAEGWDDPHVIEEQTDTTNDVDLDKFLADKLQPKLEALVGKHLSLLRGRLD